MLFHPVLTKFFNYELFSCLPEVDHVINSCKGLFIGNLHTFVKNCSYELFIRANNVRHYVAMLLYCSVKGQFGAEVITSAFTHT